MTSFEIKTLLNSCCVFQKVVNMYDILETSMLNGSCVSPKGDPVFDILEAVRTPLDGICFTENPFFI
jgi:hypothetical protein